MNKKLSTKKSYSVNLLDKPLFSSTISIAGPQLKPVEEIMSFDALKSTLCQNLAIRISCFTQPKNRILKIFVVSNLGEHICRLEKFV